jgi:hypothetical protein
MSNFKDILKYASLVPSERPNGHWPPSALPNPTVPEVNQWAVPIIAPLADGQRGIILGPPVVYDGSSLSTREFNLNDLRYAVLFFDRIAYASNNIFNVEPPDEMEWLAKEGLAEIVMCSGQGTFDTRCIIEAQKALHTVLDDNCPGVWGMWRGSDHAMFLDDETEARGGLQMRLVEAIPVPDRDVPLDDVLEFKGKRYDELVALRHHLERLYQAILESPDLALAERTETESFQAAIRDHLRVTEESGLRVRFTDLSMNFTVGDAVAALVVAQAVQLTTLEAVGVAFGAAASRPVLSIGVGASLGRQKPSRSPFEYVSRYHREVFGGES